MIICNRDGDGDFYGEITDVCDRSIPWYEEHKELINRMGTYLMLPDSITPNVYAIRFPGATRGHILVDDNNIIQEIVFYEDTMIYGNNINEECKKFIGVKIEVQQETK